MMRLWSIHPKYLDAKGLTAAWREALLAKKVLSGGTKGYRHHPQLDRFRGCGKPREAINTFLRAILNEAQARGYRFDGSKAAGPYYKGRIKVAAGQAAYELKWLKSKLKTRDPAMYRTLKKAVKPGLNPLFQAVRGGIEPWEKIK